MAAGNWVPYDQALQGTLTKTIDWTAGTLKVALFTSSYTLAQTTDALYSGITGEASGAGYTTGGTTVTSPAVATSSGTTTASGTVASWTTATIAAKYAVLYDSATSKLLAHALLDSGGATISSTASTFSVSGYSVAVTHNAS